MNRSRKDVAMMAVMGVLLLFAAYNFAFKPQQSELSRVRDDLAQVEQNISDTQLLLQAPTDTSGALPGAEPAAARPAVPPDPAMADLLRQLQAVAGTSGVALASVAPTPLSPNPTGQGGSLQISITASGPHASVLAYLEALHSLPRLLVIEQLGISVQPAAADGTSQLDQLQLAARVFTLRPPAGTPVVTVASPTPTP